MRKVKRLQAEQAKVGAAIENLETVTLSIDSTLSRIQVLDALRAGSSAIQDLQNGHSLEQLDSLLMDVEESLDMERVIQETLASSAAAAGPLMDDEELLAELMGLPETADEPMVIESEELPEAPAPAVSQVEKGAPRPIWHW